MNIAIVGSRNFADYSLMADTCSFIDSNDTIISGGARGADSLAKRLSGEKGCDYTEFAPNWEKYGKAAGYKRNIKIIEASDIVIAFWDGQSKGTKHSIDLANKYKKLLNVIIF